MNERLIALFDSAECSLNSRLHVELVFPEDLYYEIRNNDDEKFFDLSLLRSNMLELREIEDKYYQAMKKVKERICLMKERI